ncbi:hypothetical protein ACFWUP_19060 [Nocardia sp. NPDC058658]|uniref:hypothetical protein n=1 Tax=Nocardia sp. NPDC058658 TaxID=3346580 RepID=UPI003656430D
MARVGPWVTLAAVAVLGGALVAVNMSKEDGPTGAVGTASAVSPKGTGGAGALPTPAQKPTATTEFPAKADYVGTIGLASGGTMTVSITVEGDKAVAYACDGANVESWSQGSASGGTLQLTGKNDAKLDGRLEEAAVKGTLTIGAKQWAFTAQPVQAPAGLYVYESGGVRQSWIVDGGGQVTGVQRAANGSTSAAPGLGVDATAVIGDVLVSATKVSGADHVG